ncbi:MAG: hypothetical protein ACTSRG_16935 [Candidatus Helarchaeota archaeon]
MINHIWIIKDSGENLFHKDFETSMTLDENLISGLFIALNTFAKESGKGAIDSLILKDAKFIYMNFGSIFVVLGCDRSDEIDMMKEIMNFIGTKFIEKYGNLEDWDNTVDRFRTFADILGAELTPKLEREQIQKPPIIEPQLTRDELILQEYETVANEFTCEKIKGAASNIYVFLSRSLNEHFTININFKDFPEKPKVRFPRGLIKLVGKPEEALLTLANWNEKNPAKIVEIVRELESYLLKSSLIERDNTKIILNKS